MRRQKRDYARGRRGCTRHGRQQSSSKRTGKRGTRLKADDGTAAAGVRAAGASGTPEGGDENNVAEGEPAPGKRAEAGPRRLGAAPVTPE